jgi:hypothetical protein
MIELRDLDIFFFLVMFGYALRYTWNKAHLAGQEVGYNDACADVATGAITVTLVENED